MANLSAVYIGHSFEYSSWSKVYTDRNEPYTNERDHRDENGDFVSAKGHYYDNWFINPAETRDLIYERNISNRFFVQAQPWDRNGIVGTLDAGIGIDMHTYSQFELKDYLTGKYTKVNKTSYFFYGSVSGKIKKYVDWDGNLRFYPSGYRGGDLSIGAHLALKGYLRGHPLILEGRFSMDRRSPTYWQENLFSNHYIWNTPLSKENETRFEVKFSVPDFAFEAGAWQGVVSDKIYYASDSNVAQHSGNVSLTSVYARKDFRSGGLHFGQQGIVAVEHGSRCCTRSAFERLPVVLLRILGRARRAAPADRLWTDATIPRYYAPGYNPALSVYYNQRQVENGELPHRWTLSSWESGKRMRIFLKYQHVNKGLFGNGETSSRRLAIRLNPGHVQNRYLMGIL